jgi:oligopeptide transport system substrate-binding protein
MAIGKGDVISQHHDEKADPSGAATRSHRIRRATTGVIAGVLVTSLLIGCTSSDPPAGEAPPSSAPGTGVDDAGTMALGIRPIDSLDPADVVPTSQSAMVATDLLFDSLMAIDPSTDDAVPSLATEARDDGLSTVWTFPIREDATFSDGTPVTAADVKFSLERVANKGSSSLAGVRLEIVAGYQEFLDGTAPDIAGIVAVDDSTVQVTTRAPYAQLPQLLASPLYSIVPKATVESAGPVFREEPVGSGPFAFESADGTTRHLVRADPSGTGPAAIDLTEFATVEESFDSFSAGDLDWSAVPDAVTEADAGSAGTFVAEPFAAQLFFGINMANPAFADVRFRSAMVKAIDRQKIVTDIVKSPLPLNGVVPASVTTSPEVDPCGALCAYDPEAAKALVAEVFPDGNVPNVQLDFYADAGDTDTTQQQMAEAVKASLEAVGIPATLAPKPFAEYRTFAVSGGAQVFSYGWVGIAPDPDAYLAPLFLSDSPDNVTGYKNPFVDVFIADARTGDPATRDARYRDVEKLVMSNVPIIPLAELQTRVVISGAVGGYQPRIDGTFDVDTITINR